MSRAIAISDAVMAGSASPSASPGEQETSNVREQKNAEKQDNGDRDMDMVMTCVQSSCVNAHSRRTCAER